MGVLGDVLLKFVRPNLGRGFCELAAGETKCTKKKGTFEVIGGNRNTVFLVKKLKNKTGRGR